MALLNIFKKKKKEEKKEIKKKEVEEAKKVVRKEEKKPLKLKEKKFFEAHRILKSPHITEKATDLVKKNQYVFKVWPRANKTQIERAIESVFGVDVESVKIIRIPRKRRRLGRIEGFKKGYKKAIVKIKKGQKIEVLPR